MARLRIPIVAAGLAVAAPAAASPLGDPAIERAVFAGSTEASPMSLSLNPASLGAGSGTHFFATSSLTLDRISIDRRTVDPASGALEDGPSVSSTVWSPGGAVGAYAVWSRFAIGAQSRLPSAEEDVLAGDAVAYHSMGGQHREIEWMILGAAYRWRRFTVGTSLAFTNDKVALRFARDTALETGDASAGFENPDAREVYRIDTTSGYLRNRGNASVTAGVLVHLTDAWWLGASYRFPQGLLSSVQTSGKVEVQRAPRDGGDTLRGDAAVRFNLPEWLRVGARGRITDTLEVVIEGRWNRLSSFTQYDVRMSSLSLSDAGIPEIYPRPRGLRDGLSIQAGVEQIDIGQRFVLGARLGAERGATIDSHLSPAQVYPSSVTADLGLQIRIAPSVTMVMGYGLGWAPRNDSGRGIYDPIDRQTCIDSGFDIDTPACQAVRAGYAIPTASGIYGRIDNVFRLGLGFTLP